MNLSNYVPAVQIRIDSKSSAPEVNELGMRPMQERAYAKRGEQYLLIKSPPASGKSRALMFIALDKLRNQHVMHAIICVPEKSIGGSFANQALSEHGFFDDWTVEPRWNLCSTDGSVKSKVKAVGEFLRSESDILICTHATFRLAFDELGVEAFDQCMIAIDEFHHVSADSNSNRLGAQLKELIARDKAHLVTMTGSYFRGDNVPVLAPEDERHFASVTYSYYEQLNSYKHLKELDIGYYFYTGSYLDAIIEVLDSTEKTIVYIPRVNSRESTRRGKYAEVEEILSLLGTWEGVDEKTGYQLVRCADGRLLKIADLVDDDPFKRDNVVWSLTRWQGPDNPKAVDMVIALGMAKEGFDWMWCEHALTAGYRASLTEIVQIIGRTTRDAPGKIRARFTNLIAQPDASDENVREAVNDTIKAIALSLLMEQVLSIRFKISAKRKGPMPGFDYQGHYNFDDGTNIGFHEESGQCHIEIDGFSEPANEETRRIIDEDLNEIIADFISDRQTISHGLFNPDILPEQLTIERMGKIIRDRYPHQEEEDRESIRQAAVAAFTLMQKAKQYAPPQGTEDGEKISSSTALIDGLRKFAKNVHSLNIDMIDRINPFQQAYAILSKTLNETTLKQVENVVAAQKINLSYEEARTLAQRALTFKNEHGRLPSLTAQDPWEQRMAEGIVWLQRNKGKTDDHVVR